MYDKQIKIGAQSYHVFSDDSYLSTRGKTFEPNMVRLFASLIQGTDIVADIGANIGLTSLLFQQIANEVYAFEPSPSTYRILTENLRENGIVKVHAFNIGLGEKETQATITFSEKNRSGGFVSGKIRPDAGHQTESINIDTLDHFFADRTPLPSILKIDVEGFEKYVIEGGLHLLESTQPTVVLEMNHFCLNVLQRITIPDFLDFMRKTFAYLYAVDSDNCSIADCHNEDSAYMVMYEHVVKGRFPNLVAGFDGNLKSKLDTVAATGRRLRAAANRIQSMEGTEPLSNPAGIIKVCIDFEKVRAGETIELPIQVVNQNIETWCSFGKHPVLLSYHWLDADGKMYIYDGIRTELEGGRLEHGETIDQSMTLTVPDEIGAFTLILTLVQEQVCWFEDRGFVCQNLEVDVTA